MPARKRLIPLAALVLLPAVLQLEGARPSVGDLQLSEAAGWLRDYVRIDTSNPPGNEAQAADYLAGILHRHGIATETLVSPEGRASLYARLEGGGEPGQGLLLIHHLDVVPPGNGWSVPPFEGLLRDGSLWARGAVDVKSLGIAHLAALISLRKEGIRPVRDVAFLAVADEETGGGQGTAWLWQQHPELFDGIAAVYGEGGANRAPLGKVIWWGVEIAQKRPLWLRLTASGRPGHASGSNPNSAVHKLVDAVDRMLELPPQWKVTPAARTFFGALAPDEPPGRRTQYSDLDSWIGPDGPRATVLPGQESYFLDSVQVTVLAGSESINVVAPRASALVDVRLLPDTDTEEFLERLRGALGKAIDVEVLLSSPPVPPSPTETRAFAAIHSVLAVEGSVVPAFISGFTDSRYFRERGVPTYGLSPFVLDSEVLRGIHGADERIPLDEFDRGVERMKEIVRIYASGG